LAIAALVRKAGAIPRYTRSKLNLLEATRLAVVQLIQECDIVVTSGGVSVGEMDFVKQALAELGGNLQFWKVAIKPGRPFVFGRLPSDQPLTGHKPLFRSSGQSCFGACDFSSVGPARNSALARALPMLRCRPIPQSSLNRWKIRANAGISCGFAFRLMEEFTPPAIRPRIF